MSCLLRRLHASGYRGYPGYPGYLLPFFMGKMLLIIYYILLNFYIYHNFRKNTRGVTEVTEVTRDSEGLIELLTPKAEWLPVTAVTRVTRVTAVTSCLFLWGKCF